MGFNEKREFAQLEKDLEALEIRKTELETLLNSGITDHEELMAASNEIKQVLEDLETKTDRWLELSELDG